jgi:hypothetical protein
MDTHEEQLDPEDLRASALPPAKPARFEQPVTWLLGSDLLRHIGWIVLNSFFGRRLGGLDWMHAEPLITEKDRFEQAIAAETAPGKDEFWFDYIADSGDSQEATYSVAYLCLSDLWVDDAKVGEQAAFDQAPDRQLLPRGQFLFIGGDTAYHVSNPRTLLQRFRAPFCWAQKDLEDRKRASAGRNGRIYAIPGNHDYYDSLRGFNRQFRRPIKGPGLLTIPCFERVQEASYLALELPFGWWLLGLDTQKGELDFRQRHFFQTVLAERKPAKLIVATPEPSTAFDLRVPEDAPIVRNLRNLGSGLEKPLRDDAPLPEGHCRLDIAGDVHHYARYGGPPERASYASIVSGLGGAFLHPSHTVLGNVEAAKKFPSEDQSRRVINARLFKVLPVLKAGNLPLFGFLLAIVLFLAWHSRGTGEFLRWLVEEFEALCRGQSPQEWSLVHVLGTHREKLLHTSAGFWSIVVGGAGVMLAFLSLQRSARSMRRPLLAYLGFLLIALAPFTPGWSWLGKPSAGLTQSAILLMFVIFGLFVGGAAIWHRELLNERAMEGSFVTWLDRWLSLGIAACGLVGVMGAFVSYGDQPARTVAIHLTFLVFFLISALGLPVIAVLAGGQKEWRVPFRQSWAVWQSGLLFVLRWLRRGSWLLLGLWHGMLQFVIPLLWVSRGLSWAMVPGALLLVLMNVAGYRVALWRRTGMARVGLVLLWFLAGATSLAIPLIFPSETWIAREVGAVGATETSFWYIAGAVVFTGILTAVASGYWFSWYLAVSLAFDRHANEAGAVSRVADFAELVRVKLTPETLTAYVIGIDRVETDGEKLEPRLVDVFTLRVQEKATGESA